MRKVLKKIKICYKITIKDVFKGFLIIKKHNKSKIK